MSKEEQGHQESLTATGSTKKKKIGQSSSSHKGPHTRTAASMQLENKS